jgi:hypothetical protein
MTEVEWNEEQEQALINCANVTLEIQRLREEINALNTEIAERQRELKRRTSA